MNFDEFRTAVAKLLPEASSDAMYHWQQYAGEMEDHVAFEDMLDEIYISFAMVEARQERTTATELFNLATTICLNPYELPEAARLRVDEEASLQEIADGSIAGQLSPTEQDVNVFLSMKEAFLAERRAADPPLTMKLYSPVDFFLRDDDYVDDYDESYWRDELTHEEAFEYMGEIDMALDKDMDKIDSPCGLAEYIDDNALGAKVQSLIPSFELHGDRLWTVAEVKLHQPLTLSETELLKEWWTGQLSDGWGEAFEQKAIAVGRGELYVEPWSPSLMFFVDTQEEFSQRMGFAPPETPAPAQESKPQQAAADSPIPPPADPERDAILAWIAKQHCGVETLDTQGSDRLDFHDISVEGLKAALAAAYDEGQAQHMAIDDLEMSEADAPAVDEQVLRKALHDRLDNNFAHMIPELHDKMRAPFLTHMTMRELAEKIAATFAAHDFLKEHNFLSVETMEDLLRWDNPLAVVAEHWPVAKDDLLDFSTVLDDVKGYSNYIDEIIESDQAKSGREQPPTGKASLLASLHREQDRPSPPRDKVAPDHSGPEL